MSNWSSNSTTSLFISSSSKSGAKALQFSVQTWSKEGRRKKEFVGVVNWGGQAGRHSRQAQRCYRCK